MARISSDMAESLSPSTPPPCPLDPALNAALRDPVQRDQLNPMQIAEALPRLREAGWKSGDIEDAYSFSEKQIYQYGRLLKLPPAVQDQIRRKELGFSQARHLSRLEEKYPGAILDAAGRMVRDKMNQRESGDYITSLIRLNEAMKAPKTGPAAGDSPQESEPAEPESDVRAKPKNVEPAKAPPESRQMDSRFRGNDGVFEELEKSYLWEMLYSIPVLWRMLPWLRSQTQAAKGSVEKRRVFVGWLLAVAALWLFWPRIWQGVERFRRPKASNFSASAPDSGALASPAAGKSEEIPIPQMAKPVFGARHLIELHWQDLGPAYRYHVYCYCGTPYDAAQMSQVNELVPIRTPGALVDIPAYSCRNGGFLAVIAENAAHHMSDLSEPESFDGLNAANQDYKAEPLEPEGAGTPTADSGQGAANPSGGAEQGRENGGTRRDTRDGGPDLQSMSSSTGLSRQGITSTGGRDGNPATAAKGGPITGNHSLPLRNSRRNGTPAVTGSSSVPPAPTDVHYERRTPDLIILRWRPVGPPGLYTYNVYSFATADMSAPPRKENPHPMKSNVVTWTPETGLDHYWIVVTALDKQGNESGYSETIEVIRHPEKTPSGDGLLNRAAEALRQAVP